MDPTQIRKVLDRGYYLYRIFESGSEGKQIGPLTAAIRSYNSFKELGFPVKIERLNAAGFRKWNKDFDALLEWIDQADSFILGGHIHQAFDFAAFNVPSIENLEVLAPRLITRFIKQSIHIFIFNLKSYLSLEFPKGNVSCQRESNAPEC